MGDMRYPAIIVAGEHAAAEKAHAEAAAIFPLVSALSPQDPNGMRTFFIPSYGRTEGSPERWRVRLFTYLKSMCRADGSSPLDWATLTCSPLDWLEIECGADGSITKVTRHEERR